MQLELLRMCQECGCAVTQRIRVRIIPIHALEIKWRDGDVEQCKVLLSVEVQSDFLQAMEGEIGMLAWGEYLTVEDFFLVLIQSCPCFVEGGVTSRAAETAFVEDVVAHVEVIGGVEFFRAFKPAELSEAHVFRLQVGREDAVIEDRAICAAGPRYRVVVGVGFVDKEALGSHPVAKDLGSELIGELSKKVDERQSLGLCAQSGDSRVFRESSKL